MQALVSFNIRPLTTNYGKLVVNVLNTGELGVPNTEVFIGIDDPLGLAIKEFPVAPDFDHPTAGPHSVTVDIPTVTGGTDFVTGKYTVRVLIRQIDLTSNLIDDTSEYSFCPLTGNFVSSGFELKYDCFAQKIIMTDNTNYDQVTREDRLMTLDPPEIPGKDSAPNLTTADAQLIVSMDYDFTTYNAKLEANINKSSTDGRFVWTVNDRVDDSQVSNVTCDLDACEIIPCYTEFHDKVVNRSAKKGGTIALGPNDLDLFVQVNATLNLWMVYKECQDTANMVTQYDKLKILLRACGCDCPNPTQPKAFTITDGITYITGPSAYDQWVLEGNSGTFEDFLASLNPATDWVDIPDTDFALLWEDGTNQFQYRIVGRHIEFKGDFIASFGNPPVTVPNDVKILESTFAPAQADTVFKLPVVNNVDGCVGYFYKSSSDNAWYIRMTSGFNKTIDTSVSGMIPINGLLTSGGVVTVDWTQVLDSEPGS